MNATTKQEKIKNVRILNILIFIAFFAFALRGVDFVSGVSSFVQTAQAESTSNSEIVEESDDAVLVVAKIEGEDHEASSKSAGDEHGDEMNKEDGDGGGEKIEIPEWRDSSDEDVNFEQIRMELFKDMSKRRELLDEREAKLGTREALLKATEKELDQKYREMTQLRAEIEKLLEKQSDEEQNRFKSLVKIYEGMKPADAARIFNTLDLDVLVAVLSRMSERKLSGILSEMTPERARTVTIILAEQKTLPQLP